uniref:Uncharacterized protein TCIL3000_10_1980 n=1 Tax=Trypanosoma congolense (strain IL3000) TaxID=1068625 RepID=G0UVM3_TRYCI|nr:unnamed protein product [Trypanosoma congolense IL3000]
MTDSQGSGVGLTVGEVVAYERLSDGPHGETKRSWTLGTVVHCDVGSHHCRVQPWSHEAWGVRDTPTTTIMDEIRVLNDQIQAIQDRLDEAHAAESHFTPSTRGILCSGVAPSEVWPPQGMDALDETNINIRTIQKCRKKTKALNRELSKLRRSARCAADSPEKYSPRVTRFRKHHDESTAEVILTCSVVMLIVVQPNANVCLLTEDEVAAVETAAKSYRMDLQRQLERRIDQLRRIIAEFCCLQVFATEIEQRSVLYCGLVTEAAMHFLDQLTAVSSGGGEEGRNALQCVTERSVLSYVSSRTLRLHEHNTNTQSVLSYINAPKHAPIITEELRSSTCEEHRNSSRASRVCTSNPSFSSDLHRHPGSVDHARKNDPPTTGAPERPYNPTKTHHTRDGEAECGIERVGDVACQPMEMAALPSITSRLRGILEGLNSLNSSADKEAYESEIGDLLAVLHGLHAENSTLRNTLANSATKFKNQIAKLQGEKERLRVRECDLSTEILRLQDTISKLHAQQEEHDVDMNCTRTEITGVCSQRTQRQLHEKVAKANLFHPTLLEELNEQKEQLESLKRMSEADRERCHAMEVQVAAKERELRESKEAYANELCKHVKMLDVLEDENRRLQYEAQEKRAEVNTLTQENENAILSDDFQRLKERCEELKQEALINESKLFESLDSARMLEKQALIRETRLLEERSNLELELSNLWTTTETLKLDHGKELDRVCRERDCRLSMMEAELVAHRKLRSERHRLRRTDTSLSHGENLPSANHSSDTPLNSEALLCEPLWCVTLEELTALRKENDRLQERLRKRDTEVDVLTDEIVELHRNHWATRQQHHQHVYGRWSAGAESPEKTSPIRSADMPDALAHDSQHRAILCELEECKATGERSKGDMDEVKGLLSIQEVENQGVIQKFIKCLGNLRNYEMSRDYAVLQHTEALRNQLTDVLAQVKALEVDRDVLIYRLNKSESTAARLTDTLHSIRSEVRHISQLLQYNDLGDGPETETLQALHKMIITCQSKETKLNRVLQEHSNDIEVFMMANDMQRQEHVAYQEHCSFGMMVPCEELLSLERKFSEILPLYDEAEDNRLASVRQELKTCVLLYGTGRAS